MRVSLVTNGLYRARRFAGLLVLLLLADAPALADDRAPQVAADVPVIAIVIDDMGKQASTGSRVIGLPGPVACAFLPRERFTAELAVAAHRNGKEVLLHLPMDSVDARALDDGAVTLDMTERQFIRQVQENIASVPHVSGVNNHMGSLLTRHPGHMYWLMRELRRQQPSLLFVDSRTTVATVARRVAHENDVPNTERNVFLDNVPEQAAIAGEFRRLLDLARKRGSALAIGHPYPQTLTFLEQHLPDLERRYGVRLVSVSEIIDRQTGDPPTWRASWSPSRKAAKN